MGVKQLSNNIESQLFSINKLNNSNNFDNKLPLKIDKQKCKNKKENYSVLGPLKIIIGWIKTDHSVLLPCNSLSLTENEQLKNNTTLPKLFIAHNHLQNKVTMRYNITGCIFLQERMRKEPNLICMYFYKVFWSMVK